MLSVQNLSRRYGNQIALTDVNFQMKEGELLFIIGHSGAGKSTIMKLLTLEERPTSGDIYFQGLPLAHITNSEIPFYRRHLGLVFQGHHLLHDRNIFDNVALPLIIHGYPIAEIKRRVRIALQHVGLANRETAFPKHLSGGQQQRVGIARALVHGPQLLLADEPTGNLDPELSLEIMGLFRQFTTMGMSVIVTTHDLALATKFAKRMLHLEGGRLINKESQVHEFGVEYAD
ncbi:MAG: ATP-binding cassette domain-containing protein [Pseudomonadota bacterium]